MKDLEIKELYKVLEEQWGDSDNYINDLIRYSKELQAELELYKDNQEHLIKQLEEKDKRINKAKEYTDSCIFDYEENTMIGEDFKIIKDILKGSDKE